MENMRDEVIELVREEIADLAMDDPRFKRIQITVESDKSHILPKDRKSISVYVGTQMLSDEGSFFDSDGFKLIFKIRISDQANQLGGCKRQNMGAGRQWGQIQVVQV